MGQLDLKRTQFKACEPVTGGGANSAMQPVTDTSIFEVGDTVRILEFAANGLELSELVTGLTILSIDPNAELTLSASADTTSPPNSGTYHICTDNIDDGQSAVDRALRKKVDSTNIKCNVEEDLVSGTLNSPSAGKTTYLVDDVDLFAVGDEVCIQDDGGIIVASALIEAININADLSNNRSEIQIDQLGDISAAVNPKITGKDITIDECVERLGLRIDQIDQPCENENMLTLNGDPDNSHVAWEAAAVFLQNSSKVFLDGNRKKLGTCGTRAFLEQGTFPGNNDALRFDSMILQTDGNKTTVEVQSGAGFTISVTGNFNAGYDIVINDNGGAATAKEIADALNADSVVKRLVQVRYGGDGSGVVATFGPTNLAGGLDDGTGDYCEIEQVFNNEISNTGYKWIVFRIDPGNANGLNVPVCDSEDLCIDYRKALVNA